MTENPTQDRMRYGKLMDIEGKLSRIFHDNYGREIPDPTPVAPAVGYTKQPSMFDHMRALIAHQASEAAAAEGLETFDEANDFEVGDDYEPESPYEQLGSELGPLPPEVARMSAAEREALRQSKTAQAQAEHLANQPRKQGGGGGLTNRGLRPARRHTLSERAGGAFLSQPGGWANQINSTSPCYVLLQLTPEEAEWHEVNQASVIPLKSLATRCLT